MKSARFPLQLVSENVAPNVIKQNTVTKQNYLTPWVQEQWIQPALDLSVVSHSHLLCEALIQLLQSHWGGRLPNSSGLPTSFEIPDGAGDDALSEANPVSSAEDFHKHLILIDYGIGQETTIRSIQQWRSQHPASHIVVVELQPKSDLILDCIEAGAHGYALQGASSAEIVQTIEQVYRGVAQCPPEITAKLFERLAQAKPTTQNRAPSSREKPPLTQRELEVLHHVARGCSDREISTELVIEVRTVKHHVHNLLRKLQVKCRWQAAQLALENGWLSQV